MILARFNGRAARGQGYRMSEECRIMIDELKRERAPLNTSHLSRMFKGKYHSVKRRVILRADRRINLQNNDSL